MEPTGTECARCERRRLRKRVDALQGAVMHRDRRIGELEAECERLLRRVAALEEHEPKYGRTLRFHNPRHVLVKRPGQCSVTDHIPEWVEVKL